MKIFECKCGSKEVFIKENGNNKGLYCAECGKWIQWLGKDDLRLAQRQIEQSIINPIPRNLDELKEHDKQIITKLLMPYDVESIEELVHNSYEKGKADAEKEHTEMCNSCIHKVSKEDIDTIRAEAIDEFFERLSQTDINVSNYPMNQVTLVKMQMLKEQKQ